MIQVANIYILNKKNPTGTLSIKDIVEEKNHNIIMIDIASALSYAEFDEVKDCKTTHEMWIKIKDIYGGDDNVRRAKVESLKGKFDQIKVRILKNMWKESRLV